MENDNFAVFILSHGRPDKVVTYSTLVNQGYTGRIYIIIDNEDKQADKYYQNFGDKVIMFDKEAIAETFDEGDNFQDRRAVIYARNACFEIAEKLGIEYFLQLDDDYTTFWYIFSSSLIADKRKVKSNLDDLFYSVLKYYKKIPALSIALCQGGDLFGGEKSTNLKKLWLKRKAMNTFFCSLSRRFYFFGRVNEDVNTYTNLGNRGGIFFTIFNAAINQETTQRTGGGMTDVYKNEGTYIKSFYTVMYNPSSVKIYMMGGYGETKHHRIHHKIDWETTVPCIISEEYRKP